MHALPLLATKQVDVRAFALAELRHTDTRTRAARVSFEFDVPAAGNVDGVIIANLPTLINGAH